MEENEFKIAEALMDHFMRVFNMFRDAIETIPPKEWKVSDEDHLIPVRQAMHLIECAFFYCSTKTVKEFPFGEMFGGDWETLSIESLPSKEIILEKLKDAKDIVEGWLKNKENSDLLLPENNFPWTGKTIMARALYLLRHFQHHQGVIHAELHRRGILKPDWR